MDQYVYWHAPLWEVLLVILTGLAVLTWLVVRLVRRPSLAAVLSATNPALNEQPLFFFDCAKGVTCLNDPAEQVFKELMASQQQLLLDALTETLLEAHEESRVTRQADWPASAQTLVAVPVFRPSGEVAGVLGLVIAEPPPLPLAEPPIDQPLVAEAQDWLALGPSLRLHRTRPVVRVRRSRSTTAGETIVAWQEYPLSHMEETLLRYLVAHPAKVQTAMTLFGIIWPGEPVSVYGLHPTQRDRLRRLVYQLRQHVEPDPRNPRYVCTAHGVGYVLYLEEEPVVR